MKTSWLLFSFLGRLILWGVGTGALLGAAFGTLVGIAFGGLGGIKIGLLFDVMIGTLVGLVLGVVNGILLGVVTRVAFFPLGNEQRYRHNYAAHQLPVSRSGAGYLRFPLHSVPFFQRRMQAQLCSRAFYPSLPLSPRGG